MKNMKEVQKCSINNSETLCQLCQVCQQVQENTNEERVEEAKRLLTEITSSDAVLRCCPPQNVFYSLFSEEVCVRLHCLPG